MVAFLLGAGSVSVYAEDNAEVQAAVVQPEHVVVPGSHCVEITLADDQSHTVAVYALTGQVVKQVSVSGSNNVIELTPGYYIVRIDGLSKRVVVK